MARTRGALSHSSREIVWAVALLRAATVGQLHALVASRGLTMKRRALQGRLANLVRDRVLLRSSFYAHAVMDRATRTYSLGVKASAFVGADLRSVRERKPTTDRARAALFLRAKSLSALASAGLLVGRDGLMVARLRRYLIDGQPQLAAPLRARLPRPIASKTKEGVFDRMVECPGCGASGGLGPVAHIDGCSESFAYREQLPFDAVFLRSKSVPAVLLSPSADSAPLPSWWSDFFHTALVPVVPFPVDESDPAEPPELWTKPYREWVRALRKDARVRLLLVHRRPLASVRT